MVVEWAAVEMAEAATATVVVVAAAGGCRGAPARLVGRAVERRAVERGHDPSTVVGCAEPRIQARFVLGDKRRLAGIQIRREQVALRILAALLINDPIEIRLQRGRLLKIVLLKHRQPQRMCLLRHPLVVGQLLRAGDRKTSAVRPPIDVVGLDRVKTLLLTHLKTRRHDRLQHRQLADIQPPLPRPPVAVAQHRARERARIRAPVLPRPRIDVADRPLAGGLQGRDLRGAIVEPIDVIRGHRIGVVHRPRQLPIPRQQLRRHPLPRGQRRGSTHQHHAHHHAHQSHPPVHSPGCIPPLGRVACQRRQTYEVNAYLSCGYLDKARYKFIAKRPGQRALRLGWRAPKPHFTLLGRFCPVVGCSRAECGA